MGNSQTSILDELGPDFPKTIKFMKLQNLGNTCFANSILQALFNSKYVLKYFNDVNDEITYSIELPNNIKDSPFVNILQIYIKKRTQKTPEAVIIPNDFLKSVVDQAPDFVKGQQHDAQELFIFLIDSFDNTINEINEKYHKEIPLFSSIFNACSKSKCQCLNCGTMCVSNEDFNCFYISIKTKNSLTSRLRAALLPEYLQESGKRYCNCCKIRQEMKITTKYTKIPPVAVFQIQRFEYDRYTNEMKKLYDHVPFPSALQLNNCNYQLKTVVVHIGSGLNSGHFVSVMLINERWIMASDTSLSVLNNDEVYEFFSLGENQRYSQPSAYLLFYDRIE